MFNAGINLKSLHADGISMVGLLLGRELGYVAKIVRGLLVEPGDPWRARGARSRGWRQWTASPSAEAPSCSLSSTTCSWRRTRTSACPMLGRASCRAPRTSGWPRLTERFTFTKPVLRASPGARSAAGLELVLACDMVMAADNALFALPEVRLGVVPAAGGAFRLGRQMPFRAAMGHVLTGRSMTAATALRYGLINDVVPADGLDACVAAWTEDLLRAAALAQRAIKEAVLDSIDRPLPDAFTVRYHWEERRRSSADAVEGSFAFAEKRPPVWRGR